MVYVYKCTKFVQEHSASVIYSDSVGSRFSETPIHVRI